MTSRKLVYQTLEFENKEGKVPRQLWTLPWAEWHHGEMLRKIRQDYPEDIIRAPNSLKEKTIEKGDPYRIGTSIDAWGSIFTSIHEGVFGEARTPLIEEEEWEDVEKAHIPREWLTFDRDEVNTFCRNTDCFVTSACCPRPFEQLQFLRTTELLYMDLMEIPSKMEKFIKEMHAFYCELLEEWAKTEVDALTFMDDWGSQNSLLINPQLWRKLFKPMYRDYIDIAHRYHKKAFMHSDGYTVDIYPDLIELGLDAFNSQIFCMGIEKVAPFAGQITFWGEIDRQHLLVDGTPEDVRNAVKQVKETLWENGGCIAQFEFGPGAKPENAYEVFKAWEEV